MELSLSGCIGRWQPPYTVILAACVYAVFTTSIHKKPTVLLCNHGNIDFLLDTATL